MTQLAEYKFQPTLLKNAQNVDPGSKSDLAFILTEALEDVDDPFLMVDILKIMLSLD